MRIPASYAGRSLFFHCTYCYCSFQQHSVHQIVMHIAVFQAHSRAPCSPEHTYFTTCWQVPKCIYFAIWHFPQDSITANFACHWWLYVLFWAVLSSCQERSFRVLRLWAGILPAGKLKFTSLLWPISTCPRTNIRSSVIFSCKPWYKCMMRAFLCMHTNTPKYEASP